jgi:light-regulated signal transduction histidine kinase (bacteriophytochrome)
VKKGDADLLEQLNQGLLIIKTKHEYDRIYEKWLTAEEPWRKLQKYLWPAIVIAIAIALIVGFWLIMLQLLVKKRTRQLSKSNEMLRLAREGLEEKVAQRTIDLANANISLQNEITEHKRSEERIKKLNEDLIGHVKQVEIANQQLNRAIEELARSNRDLEEFAYVASHDLQEPLRKIANFSEMLAHKYRGHLDEQGDRYFGYISDGAKRMQALINDLLAYSRISSADFQLMEASLEDVLQAALTDLQTLIRENKAEISHDTLPSLKVNPIQLRRLFQNLINNGIKFHDVHPPRIHISARQDPGEWVISVRDNGIGFDPQYAKQIFKVFKRLHAKEVYPGTGIGLAICKKIVERHGGSIWAESGPGRGSTFYFTIPM